MDKSQQKHFQKILENRRRELLAHVKQCEEELAEVQANKPADHQDAAPWERRQAMLRGQIEEERDQLEQIDEALQRLEEGTYGICAECGQPIRKERLEARPLVQYCIECQAMLEG